MRGLSRVSPRSPGLRYRKPSWRAVSDDHAKKSAMSSSPRSVSGTP